jgi:hypothetical protein
MFRDQPYSIHRPEQGLEVGAVTIGKEAMDNPHSSEPKSASGNPLQAVMEIIRGYEPEAVCKRHNISRDELNSHLEAYQKSLRQMALTDDFTKKQAGRNDPCPCGSGKKYKKCCLARHEEARKSISLDELREMEEKVKRRESLEQEIGKGFDFLFSRDYGKARKLASSLLETFPEDDRLYDIIVSVCMVTGEYDEAFEICNRRLEIALEEKDFFLTNGQHKREGDNRKELVHFYSPSIWLEKFWMAQRARAWREQFATCDDDNLQKLAGKLEIANDLNRFPARQEAGYELRRKALEPVLGELRTAGVAAVPYLLPLTFSYSWASLFVPDLLGDFGTDECIRLLAELSMFRFPSITQRCLMNLERLGIRVVPEVEGVMQRDSEFDELKVGLVSLLGHLPCPESFAVLTRWIDHESPHVVTSVAEALGRHGNPDAQRYLDRVKARLSKNSEIAGAIQDLAAKQKKSN